MIIFKELSNVFKILWIYILDKNVKNLINTKKIKSFSYLKRFEQFEKNCLSKKKKDF